MLDPTFKSSLLTLQDNEVSVKSSSINKCFCRLSCRRLGHISIERILKLVDDGVLKAYDL